MTDKFVDDIERELDRLGVERGAPYSSQKLLGKIWRTAENATWQKNDPTSAVTEVPDFYRHFLGLRWLAVGRVAYLDPVDDTVRHVHLSQASENYDLIVQGHRALLYAFAYDTDYQMFFSFNLLEHSPNPKVYAVPHDEVARAYVRYDTVHQFLQTLHQEADLPAPDEDED